MKLRRGVFRRREHRMPGLNTAALPDLIFTVLFFFMIVTTMRQVERKVSYRVPQGTEISKLGHKSSVVYISIGPPAPHLRATMGTKTCIQLNNKLATTDDIVEFINAERARMTPEEAQRMTVSLRIDRNTEMGVVADVKMALRRAKATRVNYSATKKPSPATPKGKGR